MFKSSVEGLAKGSVLGATRKSITEAAENSRAKVLVEAQDLGLLGTPCFRTTWLRPKY